MRVRVVEVDTTRMEAVEVEELGIGQELQIRVSNINVAGQVVGGGNVVEVGEVLRHVRGAAAVVCRHGAVVGGCPLSVYW